MLRGNTRRKWLHPSSWLPPNQNACLHLTHEAAVSLGMFGPTKSMMPSFICCCKLQQKPTSMLLFREHTALWHSWINGSVFPTASSGSPSIKTVTNSFGNWAFSRSPGETPNSEGFFSRESDFKEMYEHRSLTKSVIWVLSTSLHFKLLLQISLFTDESFCCPKLP